MECENQQDAPIGIDESAGECHKVYITHVGKDDVDFVQEVRKKNSVICCERVFNAIKSAINEYIFWMAENNIDNESHVPENNYPVKLDHTYPISLSEDGKILRVSLILLDDVPVLNELNDPDINAFDYVRDTLFEVYGLQDAVELADEVIDKTRFFVSAEERGFRPSSSEYTGNPTTSIDNPEHEEYDVSYSRNYGMQAFDHDKGDLDVSNMRMAFICYANTSLGQVILKNISLDQKNICHALACEERQLHTTFQADSAAGVENNLIWPGRGRFNPTAGYMPGGIILAHEMGHTIFGGEYGDFITIGVTGRDERHNNVECNENSIRTTYGMCPRKFYFNNNPTYKGTQEYQKCFNPKGEKIDCPPIIQAKMEGLVDEENCSDEVTIYQHDFPGPEKDNPGQVPPIWSEK